MDKKIVDIVLKICNEHKTSNKNRNRMIESILWEFAKEVSKLFNLNKKEK